MDFYVIKGIPKLKFHAESYLELTSDHSPIIISVSGNKVLQNKRPCRLHSAKTDWLYFRELVKTRLNIKVSLKTEADIEKAVEHFNYIIQHAAWEATPPIPETNCLIKYSAFIKEKILEKRKLRKTW